MSDLVGIVQKVTVPQWEHVYNTKSEPDYTLFDLHVLTNKSEWVVKKRFSDLYSVHTKLVSRFGESYLPEFPPRTLTSIGNYEPEFVEKRRRLLAEYFAKLNQGVFRHPALVELLGTEDEGIARKPVLQKMALHRFQLTEANRPLPKLPDTVTLSNGEECYVKLIVDSVAEALAQIQSIHDDVHFASPPQRVAIVYDTQGVRTTASVQLRDALHQINTLVFDIMVQSDERLFDILHRCRECATGAISWNDTLELDVANAYYEADGGSAGSRVEKYRQEAEDLMALLIQGVKTKADVELLRAAIKMDIKVFGIRKQHETVTRLEEILSHLSNIQAPKGDVADSASSVAQFEAELFALAEEINYLIANAKSADTTEYEALIARGKATRQRITTLASSMRTLRGALEKQNDQANTRALNSIEDLQENLADLEYTFKSGFEESESTLYSMFKEKQVSTARKQHQSAESSLFEL